MENSNNIENQNNGQPDCCKSNAQDAKETKGFLAGIIYGLIPHIGCIAFILFTILGVTTATTFFRPLLLNSYFFYILIALSLVFATISAMIYLKKNGILSAHGVKRKWKYLSVLYGTTIFVNLFLFLIVFPYATNAISSPSITGAAIGIQDDLSKLTIQVDIPCSGHAPLITGELNKIVGITGVKFRLPNQFDISYDSSKTSTQQILALEIFQTYKAIVLSESTAPQTIPALNNPQSSSGGSCCGGGSCGGSGGSCCGASKV